MPVTLPLPVREGTPVPRLPAPLSPQNAQTVIQPARWGKGNVNAMRYSPDGSLLAVATSVGIYLYKAQTLEELRFLESEDWVVSLAFSPDGETLAAGCWDGAVWLWRVEDGAFLRSLERPPGASSEISSVAFFPDGQTIVSVGSNGGRVHFWRVSDGVLLRTLAGQDTVIVRAVAFSPDREIVAVGGEDGRVQLWRLRDGQRLQMLRSPAWMLWDVAFSPDGQIVASAFGDGVVRLWQAGDGKLLRALGGESGMLLSVAFSPDGESVAAGCWDGTIRLWRVRDGALLHVLEGHTDWVREVVFSPDGETLVSRSDDGTIRLWRVRDGALLRMLEGQIGGGEASLSPVMDVTSSPEGGRVRYACGGLSVEGYELCLPRPSVVPLPHHRR